MHLSDVVADNAFNRPTLAYSLQKYQRLCNRTRANALCTWLNRERCGCKSTLHLVANCREGGLEMPGKARGVEKRISIPIAGKFILDGGQSNRITRKLERQIFVFATRFRDEFGKTDRAQKADCHPRSKAFAGISNYRESGPKCVAGSRAGIEWKRIQEQIGKTISSKIFR